MLFLSHLKSESLATFSVKIRNAEEDSQQRKAERQAEGGEDGGGKKSDLIVGAVPLPGNLKEVSCAVPHRHRHVFFPKEFIQDLALSVVLRAVLAYPHH